MKNKQLHQNIGVQVDGSSPTFTKLMALEALRMANIPDPLICVADIGGGYGELSVLLSSRSKEVWLVDYSPPSPGSLPTNVKTMQSDLNHPWELPDCKFDFTFSLECIEHVENPRHFVREIARITKSSGYIFISTPNNHSLASKLTFLLLGQHRLFQKYSYPAHITPLLKCDFERMAREVGLKVVGWVYSNTDTMPKLHIALNLPGSAFSVSLGVLLQKL